MSEKYDFIYFSVQLRYAELLPTVLCYGMLDTSKFQASEDAG